MSQRTKKPTLKNRLKLFVQTWGAKTRGLALPIALVIMLWLSGSTMAKMGSSPANGSPYRFALLEDGTSIQLQSMPGEYRSEETVARFAGDIIALGFRWDSTKKDAEIEGYRFPASYHMVANAMKTEPRFQWLDSYVVEYGGGFQGSTKAIDRRAFDYHPILIEPPKVEKLKEGEWVAYVKAVVFTENKSGQIVGSDSLFYEFGIVAINPNFKTSLPTIDPTLSPYIERFWSDGLAVSRFVEHKNREYS